MAEKLEALWLVERVSGCGGLSFKVFRTRKAARDYQGGAQKRTRSGASYRLRRATWGPES